VLASIRFPKNEPPGKSLLNANDERAFAVSKMDARASRANTICKCIRIRTSRHRFVRELNVAERLGR
jgi:hypothetical protein